MLCSCIDCDKKCISSLFFCSNECANNKCGHRYYRIKCINNSIHRSLSMSTGIMYQPNSLNIHTINDLMDKKTLIRCKKNHYAIFFTSDNMYYNNKFKWFPLNKFRIDQDKKYYMKDIYGNEERVSRRVLNYYNIYSKLKSVDNTNGAYFNFNNFELVCLAYINLPLEYYINELCIGLNITHNGEWNLQFGNWVKKDDFIDLER